jgi:hypothetical protein
MFADVDLTTHLHCQPAGAEVGLDASVIFGSDGQGLTTASCTTDIGPSGCRGLGGVAEALGLDLGWHAAVAHQRGAGVACGKRSHLCVTSPMRPALRAGSQLG